MKSEEHPSRKKLNSAATAAHPYQANGANASPSRKQAGTRPTRLSSDERHLEAELAPHWRAESQSFSHDPDEQEWLEAEIGNELDRMRKRGSRTSD